MGIRYNREQGFTAENAEGTEMTEGEGLDQITDRIIQAAISVHHPLGPGLNETILKNGIRRRVNSFPDNQRTPRPP
jgi:hypothetical protein